MYPDGMSNMMRGRTYSCGCCHSKGRMTNPDREADRREAQRLIREWLAEEEDVD